MDDLLEDNELDLDNQDDLDDEDVAVDDDSATDEEDEASSGNLAKALQAERREKRELKERMAKLEEDHKRANAFIERVGGFQQQSQQADPNQQRAELQQLMLERPDEFAGLIQRQMQGMIRQQAAPALSLLAERVIKSNPDHSKLYANPKVATVVDNFIDSQIENGFISTKADLQEVVTNTMDSLVTLIGAVSGSEAPVNKAKSKLSNISGKGSVRGNSSKGGVLEEKASLLKSNPREFFKWADQPQNKKALNSALFGG